jgi:hypothetical protein
LLTSPTSSHQRLYSLSSIYQHQPPVKMDNTSSLTADDEWLKETPRIEAWLKELQLASTVDAQEKER